MVLLLQWCAWSAFLSLDIFCTFLFIVVIHTSQLSTSAWQANIRITLYSGQILTYAKIATRVTPCQNLPRQIRPASKASSRGAVQQFTWYSFRGFHWSEVSYIPSTVPSITQSFLRSLLRTRTLLPPRGRLLRSILPLRASNYINRPHWSSPSTQQAVIP